MLVIGVKKHYFIKLNFANLNNDISTYLNVKI